MPAIGGAIAGLSRLWPLSSGLTVTKLTSGHRRGRSNKPKNSGDAERNLQP